MASVTATALGCRDDHVLVASTGVIGVNLKMDKVRAGVPAAVAGARPPIGGAGGRARRS